MSLENRSQENQKPNLLWIFVDQHRAQALGCAGDVNIETPHIDRLQAEGIRFENAYSNTPICTPARGTVNTGRYISGHSAKANHYPLLPGENPQMAEVMAEAGYRCCHHGKWHLCGGTVNQHFVSPFFRPGWHDWVGWECMHGLAGDGTYFATKYGEGHRDIRAKTAEGFQPDWLTTRTLQWLDEQDADKPWFHCLSIETPHTPVNQENVSPEHYALFAEKELQYRENVPEDALEETDYFLRGYYSHIANIDDNLGRIYEKLEERGELENTIIIYFSDHGDRGGSHGFFAKCTPEEESSGVPFLIRLPKSLDATRRNDKNAEHVSKQLISLVDLMPTSLGLCGLEIPESCHGTDYSAHVRGYSEKDEEPVFLMYENSYLANKNPKEYWRCIRVGDWKYSINLKDGPYQLFNLNDDPYEMENLINNPAYAEKQAALDEAMRQKAASINDNYFERLAQRGNLV